jgi:hypothetical protein
LRALGPVDPALMIAVENVVVNPERYRKSPRAKAVASKKVTTAKKKPSRAKKPTAPRAIGTGSGGIKLGFAPLTDAERAEADASINAISRTLFRRGPSAPSEALIEARRLDELLESDPNNAGLQSKLEQAGLMAGRALLAEGRYADACAAFYALRRVPSAHEKGNRNLSSAALKAARAAENENRRADALMFWTYLQAAEPGSDVAAKGIARCR